MWIGGHGQWGGVAEFVTPLSVSCVLIDVAGKAPVNTQICTSGLCYTNTQKEPCVNSGRELPRHVFLLFYCRNLEKHISLTCKCGVSPLDVSIHSCCLPDAAVARCVALIFYLQLVKLYLCPIQNVTKAQGGDWCVQEMNKKGDSEDNMECNGGTRKKMLE